MGAAVGWICFWFKVAERDAIRAELQGGQPNGGEPHAGGQEEDAASPCSAWRTPRRARMLMRMVSAIANANRFSEKARVYP
jgi:hypothetical protein